MMMIEMLLQEQRVGERSGEKCGKSKILKASSEEGPRQKRLPDMSSK
jgi:hypothetical protein